MLFSLRFTTQKSFIVFAGIISACQPSENSSQLNGDFRTQQFDEFYTVYAPQPPASAIFYHMTSLPNLPDLSEQKLSWWEMATALEAVAFCFKIDGKMLTSLVRAESYFRTSAVSRTGAVGLTQFTTIGITEVNDQLGLRGPTQARSTTISVANDYIECVATALDYDWRQLWEIFPDSQKQGLIERPIHALIYGATLLKTNLAVVNYKLQQTGGSATMQDIYYQALLRYNGDPDVTVRNEYAAKILRFADAPF